MNPQSDSISGEMNLPIPQALFSCGFDYCRLEVSYHADQLRWCADENKWVCDFCWENIDSDVEKGIRLDEYLKSLNLFGQGSLQKLIQT